MDSLFPIVDTHHHLWDLSRFRLPWLAGVPRLDRSFLLEDYREATRGLNVSRTVYMEVDVEPEQQANEAEYIFGLCDEPDNPLAAAVISGRPGLPGFRDYLDRFRASPHLRGIRQVLHSPATPPGYCLQPEFVRDIRHLGEQGLSFDLCMRPGELSDGIRLADLCPDTPFILDHCGNPGVRTPDLSPWRRCISEFAARQNVVCKVSGIIASADPEAWKPSDLEPVVRHVLSEFGPDRVMFGGDWPVCTLTASFAEWVEALTWIVRDLSVPDRRKLFHDNAVAFYRL